MSPRQSPSNRIRSEKRTASSCCNARSNGWPARSTAWSDRRKRGFLGDPLIVAVLACAHRCSYGEGWRIVRILGDVGEAAAIHESDGTATTLSRFGRTVPRGGVRSNHGAVPQRRLCVLPQVLATGATRITGAAWPSFFVFSDIRVLPVLRTPVQGTENRMRTPGRSGLTNRGRPSRHGAPERAAHRVGGQPGPVGPPPGHADETTSVPCDEGVLLTKRVPQGRMHHAGDETP